MTMLLDNLNAYPEPADAAFAKTTLSDLRDALKETPWASIAATDAFATLANALCGNSSFLALSCTRYPDLLPRLASEPVSEAFDTSLVLLREQVKAATTFTEVMSLVRRAKTEIAVRAAAADVAMLWSLEKVTESLTEFADAVLQAGLHWLLAEAAAKGDIVAAEGTGGDTIAATSGLVILAMGKYGSGELNYSSDIDIVVFYEPSVMTLREGLDQSTFFVRLTKNIVKLMQERTADGYVFRTDLRLRPDPGGTPVAVSLPAAEQYYESRGQNWERAAFIKARVAAGDKEAGERFLSMLAPFIWRKYLDYAAIEDIHSMKRQIHAVGGHGKIAIAGHNIKLGRGGIREIEFFVQTQQLIAGGRDLELRGKQTCDMLGVLAEKSWIEPEVADDLRHAYRFLRTLEHRLQMVNDEQTHSMPMSDEGVAHIAIFMGFSDKTEFEGKLRDHLMTVQKHYIALFESAPPLGEEGGSLVFTGTDDDPETIETLRSLGFEKPDNMSEIIRSWHAGRYVAMRSPRARERLTALMPELLRALSRTADPDAAFLRFDQFLGGLPAGVQLFSLLYANPSLLDLIAGICGTAPRLSNYLSQNATVLDAVLAPDFFSMLPDATELEAQLDRMFGNAKDYLDILDFARVWAREQRFRLGVRVLSASADAREVGPAYSAVATSLIRQIEPHVVDEIALRHGHLPGGEMAVIAMGKLGSSEMSAVSDLDIITIYDVADAEALSNGEKPLMASQYYARVTQKLVSALTVPTAEGKLYEVDLRLRPSGNAGPVATQLSSFATYQLEEAWTWEHMALTRARVICGPVALTEKIEQIIHQTLQRPRDAEKVARDVAEMRQRIEKEFPAQDPWELKHVRGGLIDLEFIAQYLQLVHANRQPDILTPNTRSVFERAAALKLLDLDTASLLLEAFDLHHDLVQVIRICVEGVVKLETATQGLRTRLAQAGKAPNVAVLEATLKEAQSNVLSIFSRLIDGGGT